MSQPALSVGNVGQMAIDLLIFGLRMNKVGYIDSPHVISMVGNNAFTGDGSLTTSLEGFNRLTLLIFSLPECGIQINSHPTKSTCHQSTYSYRDEWSTDHSRDSTGHLRRALWNSTKQMGSKISSF